MSGNDDGFVRQIRQLLKRIHQSSHIAARKIGASDRTREKRISGEKELCGWEMVTNSAGSVSRSIDNLNFKTSYLGELCRGDELLRRGNRRIVRRHLVEGMGENGNILLTDKDRQVAVATLEFVHGSDMVEMSVGEQNPGGFEVLLLKLRGDKSRFRAWIDNVGLAVDGENRAVNGIKADFKSFAIGDVHR